VVTFKVLKQNGSPLRLVTPDGRSHTMKQDAEKKHLFVVAVPELALVPDESNDAMSAMFEQIKIKWMGDHLPYLLEFLTNNKKR